MRSISLSALLIVVAVTAMEAQVHPTPLASRVLADIYAAESPMRRADALHTATEILAGRIASSDADRDAIADGVARVALSANPQDGLLSIQAVTAISLSATRGTGAHFAGAFERLLLISDSASDIGLRAAALSAIALNYRRADALGVLKLRATESGKGSLAYTAVTLLHERLGRDGDRVLLELFNAGLIKGSYAMAWVSYNLPSIEKGAR